MLNTPVVKTAIVAVSRNCFPASLSQRRRQAVVAACRKAGTALLECQTIVEVESDALKALEEAKSLGANALVVYLGNFGPEGPETLLAQKFDGPVMFCAAAEETQEDLIDGRGDAYCGLLNASYNLGLRGVRAYIPEVPYGTAEDIAAMIADFEPIARIFIGIKKLKIFGFGPRPYDFLACNAPIKALFDLGIEVQENSELDLYEAFLHHAGDPRIEGVAAEMAAELGNKNPYADLLVKLAQYELTLLDWMESNLGASEYAVFANKCWPAFQTMFHFVPCYVNSRLAAKGYPVACEVDIYGALSEYILQLATQKPVTILDVNNTVPKDMAAGIKGYKLTDLFMGFHCGNTPLCNLREGALKYQLIMKRSLEPDSEPNISRGTLEGSLIASPITLFRLQSTADTKLRSYIAEGESLDTDPRSFGGIGVIAISEMARFYRHVLVEKRFPHHAGVGFAKVGKILFEAMKLLGVEDISFNRPAGCLYPTENPFC